MQLKRISTNSVNAADLTVTPVILSGGVGSRLWPLSRSMYPKQFLDMDGTGPLLATTLRRLPYQDGYTAPIIVCNNDHRFLVSDTVEAACDRGARIILENKGQNTAPAIAIAALAACDTDPEAIIVVMPSDHIIADTQSFEAAALHAAKVASEGKFILFGIKPTRPHSGYGYIKRGTRLESDNAEVYAVEKFYEKPDLQTAERYLQSGDYYWNSGVFVLHAASFLSELERLQPDVMLAARAAWLNSEKDLGFIRLHEESFAQSPSISVDHAVMEHTDKAVVLPLDVGWNDIGSWDSLADMGDKDTAGNVCAGLAKESGQTILEDTRDTYIHSSRSLVATLGIDNLIIVETPDALLVSNRDRAEDVSKLVKKIKSKGGRKTEQHLRCHRPWGYFEQLGVAGRFQVKVLHVKPGAELSLQMHHHRSEHWVVVQGTAEVTIGSDSQLVRENESVYITATQWHQLKNPGKVPLEIIEVQIGSYLGEDDIIRSNDVYHRSANETK